MNRMEISFAEPAGDINGGPQAGSLVQEIDKVSETQSVSNRSKVPTLALELTEARRKGDEAHFETLIDRYHARLLGLARMFVPNEALAQEVVQETWGKILEEIQLFEGQSSLEILIFQILTIRVQNPGKFQDKVGKISTRSLTNNQ